MYYLFRCDNFGCVVEDEKCCGLSSYVFLTDVLSEKISQERTECVIKKCDDYKHYYYALNENENKDKLECTIKYHDNSMIYDALCYNNDNECPYCDGQSGKFYNECFIHKGRETCLRIFCNYCDQGNGVVELTNFIGLCYLENIYSPDEKIEICDGCIDKYIVTTKQRITDMKKDKHHKNYDTSIISEARKNIQELNIYRQFYAEICKNWPLRKVCNINRMCMAKTINGDFCKCYTEDFKSYCKKHKYIYNYTYKQYKACDFCPHCDLWADLKIHKCQ